ncbi:alkylhydroperoxidase [Salmonella enterica subsp. enterica]|uniref:Alkylhydroperoxidase n=1 Tax=Salmonella enterica I TaxID=59201 RepID=A0A447PZZ4_SALET|nr:alkylhydroperoxidase [Salmonella enterica subsp. enterica]
MTTLRQPYYELSPEVYSALVQAKNALEKSTLDLTLMELIYLRVSQNKWLCILPGDAQ